MQSSVYVETSVISYLTSKPHHLIVTAARQQITHDWWDRSQWLFDRYISGLVIEEAGRGDRRAAQKRLAALTSLPILPLTEEAERIADYLLTDHCVPQGSREDAVHIAIAAHHGMDYLLTWNFRHINNAQKKSDIYRSIENLGYVCPILCSPEELLAE